MDAFLPSPAGAPPCWFPTEFYISDSVQPALGDPLTKANHILCSSKMLLLMVLAALQHRAEAPKALPAMGTAVPVPLNSSPVRVGGDLMLLYNPGKLQGGRKAVALRGAGFKYQVFQGRMLITRDALERVTLWVSGSLFSDLPSCGTESFSRSRKPLCTPSLISKKLARQCNSKYTARKFTAYKEI